eukprot:1337567-Amorphochlora_amoeboformis.AAC.1
MAVENTRFEPLSQPLLCQNADDARGRISTPEMTGNKRSGWDIRLRSLLSLLPSDRLRGASQILIRISWGHERP